MKRIIYLLVIIPFLLGCSDDEKKEDNVLLNTSWKLEGMIDSKRDDLTHLSPNNCDKCYVLNFNTENSMNGFGVVNSLGGYYYISKDVIHFSDLIYTEVGTIYKDEDLFFNFMSSNTIFEIKNGNLILYSVDKTTCLLFSLILEIHQ